MSRRRRRRRWEAWEEGEEKELEEGLGGGSRGAGGSSGTIAQTQIDAGVRPSVGPAYQQDPSKTWLIARPFRRIIVCIKIFGCIGHLTNCTQFHAMPSHFQAHCKYKNINL